MNPHYRGQLDHLKNFVDGCTRAQRIADVDAKSATSFLARLKKEDSCYLLHLSEGTTSPDKPDSIARKHFRALEVAPNQWAINDRFTGIHAAGLLPEDLAVLAATPDVTADEVATIAPNDVIQLQLNAGVDEATATVAFSSKAGTTYKGTAWSERGADPTACDDAFDDRTLDLAAVSDMGDPILLPAGDYTVRITGLRDNGAGRGTPVELTGSFTVKGDRGDPATDPAAIESHVRPSQCRN